ncbi:MAG: helix-turn-helix transcriptional regulator [Chlorobiaceae bacterium]|nr:helix-turn-helix transcriptional regulator [Chlorobiaceae bacterium]
MSAPGERLRDARLRRRFSMETVCIRADISRPTLYKIEHGDPSVSIGHYVKVLRVLGMVEDLACIVKEDRIGRRIQDESLPHRKRAPRTKRSKGDPDAEAW